jgi:hypothetical protein
MIHAIKSDGTWKDIFDIISIGKNHHTTRHRFDPTFDNMDGFPPETHDVMEWIFVTDGDFEITINGETEKFSLKNQPYLIVIRPREIHSLRPLSYLQYLVIKKMPEQKDQA